jgi:hypothetical protein
LADRGQLGFGISVSCDVCSCGLEQTYFVTQIVAGIAVVLSIIYLALQLKQNTRAVRLNTLHGISEAFRAQYALVGASEAVASVYMKGLSQPDELNQAERVQFYALMHNQVRSYENAFYQHTEGALDERYWAGMLGQMVNTSSQPGFVQYWNDRRSWYSDAFQHHMEQVVIPDAVDFELGGSVAAK